MHQPYWEIPLFDLDIGDEEIDAVVGVLKSRWLSQGPLTRKFEEEFSRYLGVKHTLLTSSGTTALHLAYRTLGISPNDEVIVPSLTFVATVSPIIWLGAKPIFADIKSPTVPLISVETVEHLISHRTKAIVFMAYGGNSTGVQELAELASSRGVYLIEDASHASGSHINGKKPGSFGIIGCFSFFSNKTLPVGEGGALVTNDTKIFEHAKLLRSHGMTSLSWDRYSNIIDPRYDIVDLGYNYRASEMEAALALIRLKKLKGNVERRRKLVSLYRELIISSNLPVQFIENPIESSAHYIFPILLEDTKTRDKLIEHLVKNRIQTSIHYLPIHLFRYFREKLGTGPGMLPVTEDVGARELTLPLYPTMTESQVETVVSNIKKFFYG